MRKQIPHVDEILEITMHDLHSFFLKLFLYILFTYILTLALSLIVPPSFIKCLIKCPSSFLSVYCEKYSPSETVGK